MFQIYTFIHSFLFINIVGVGGGGGVGMIPCVDEPQGCHPPVYFGQDCGAKDKKLWMLISCSK